MKKISEKIKKTGAALLMLLMMTNVAVAADDTAGGSAGFNPLDAIHSFADLMTGVAQGLGVLALIYAFIEFGVAYFQRDSSAKLQAMIFLVGGAILFSTPWLLTFLGVTY